MKKGDPIGRNEDGEILYFIGYSIMKWENKPLLLCHTNKNATPRLCGHYREEYFNKQGRL